MFLASVVFFVFLQYCAVSPLGSIVTTSESTVQFTFFFLLGYKKKASLALSGERIGVGVRGLVF